MFFVDFLWLVSRAGGGAWSADGEVIRVAVSFFAGGATAVVSFFLNRKRALKNNTKPQTLKMVSTLTLTRFRPHFHCPKSATRQ